MPTSQRLHAAREQVTRAASTSVLPLAPHTTASTATATTTTDSRGHVANAVISIFTPVQVRCGGQLFETTLVTLCSVPGSVLETYFSEPFPILDSSSGAHCIPAEVTNDAAAFACVLDCLRSGGEWAPLSANMQLTVPYPPDYTPAPRPDCTPQAMHARVVRCMEALGLYPQLSHPPAPPSVDGTTGCPIVLPGACYEYQEVVLPLSSGGKSGKAFDTNLIDNTCVMIAGLALRGFSVITEYPLPKPTSSKAGSQPSGSPMSKSQSAARDNGADGEEQMQCSIVLLERRVQDLPLVDTLAESSTWLSALSRSG